MRQLSAILACIAGLLLAVEPADNAWAEQFRRIDQFPGLIDQDDSKIKVANLGTVDLSMMYLDGDWKTIQVPSGRYIVLQPRETNLSVSFNDGFDARSVTLSSGMTYALFFSSGRWSLAPYDDVVSRRPGVFRSR